VTLAARILFIGAHCDDIELLAGGLLARACFSGRRVGVLVFSDHRGVLDLETAARARGEFTENVAWLRTESGTDVRDHSDQMLPACRGAFQSERGVLYAAMEALRNDYDLVVTHAPTDTNQDHRQVAEEAARVFKAHLSLLGGEFPNNDLGGFKPQVYVALSARELDAKVRMVGRYRSQDFGGRPYLDAEMVRALARLRGSQIREPAAEAFAVVGRMVMRATDDGR
jgi:LmbE family N-acetylglucosaminyl deacetylase